jgi:hypothetical protein
VVPVRNGRLVVLCGVFALVGAAVLAGCVSGTGGGSQGGHRPRGYNVYWDQNEEEDFLAVPSNRTDQLIPPWDPNGQLCILRDGSGRAVVGYNPTVPGQHNLGGLRPYKQPAIGEELVDRQGDFLRTLYVPGPYALPGTTVGGDIPPDATGNFNNDGTDTGCAVDRSNNVFAVDVGTAQGDFPPPDDGRLIEWFAPTYRTSCIVLGPTTGGVGAHHVDGHGGLLQPGDMSVDPATDDILLPEAGSPTGGIGGRVLRIAHTSLPQSAKDCPGELYSSAQLHVSTFVHGTSTFLPFPTAIARDSTCNCWAIATVIGDPSVAWVHDDGSVVPNRSIPGEPLAQVGRAGGFNPYGLAIAPDGTVYLADIHIRCSAPLVGCGPGNHEGQILRASPGALATPIAIASGYDFPTSVTVCVPRETVCPDPSPFGPHS